MPSSPTLRSLRMRGPYPLDAESIEFALDRRSPGNFALGFMEDGAFRVFLVGRADSDLRQSLEHWIGIPSASSRYVSATKAPWQSQHCQGHPLGRPALGAVGTADSAYTHFAFSYARSAAAALEKQCRNYDDFGGRAGLDNVAPPGAGEHPDSLVSRTRRDATLSPNPWA